MTKNKKLLSNNIRVVRESKTKTKILKTQDLLFRNIPKLLDSHKWKKSMKWGEFDLNWGRPLKSILTVFDKKTVNFQFYHIQSSNSTYIDSSFEEKKKIFKDFKDFSPPPPEIFKTVRKGGRG